MRVRRLVLPFCHGDPVIAGFLKYGGCLAVALVVALGRQLGQLQHIAEGADESRGGVSGIFPVRCVEHAQKRPGQRARVVVSACEAGIDEQPVPCGC